MVDRLGVRVFPSGVDGALGVFESEGGLPVFVTGEPYLLSDGVSLMDPVSVFDAKGETFTDSAGSLQSSLAVSGLLPYLGVAWDSGVTWDNGTYWS